MAYGAASKRDTQFTTRYLRGFLLSTSAAIAVVCIAPQLAAQEIAATPQQSQAVRNFDIPSQPLASALALFNRQSGIQISQAAAGRTSNVTTRAVRGRMTPEQALAQLLDGTGVHYQFTANRAAVIGPRRRRWRVWLGGRRDRSEADCRDRQNRAKCQFGRRLSRDTRLGIRRTGFRQRRLA
ncbi:STN domain-containing protein [Sinorhizobium meliloti]|nr:STN domain-containing protein [Sinorhizobium meliloti]